MRSARDYSERDLAIIDMWKYVDVNMPYNIQASELEMHLTNVWFACDGEPNCTTALAADYLRKLQKECV